MSEFMEYLKLYADVPTYFWRSHHGNNGDELIRIGTEHALTTAKVKLVGDPASAGHIVFQGSGDFRDVYGDGYLRTIEEFIHLYPRSRITIAPSTFAFETTDAVPFLAHSRQPVVWFARDRQSFANLTRIGERCELVPMLSHDCALELYNSEYIQGLRESGRMKHVLIAMRKDIEGNAGILTHTHGRWLPVWARRPLSQLRDRLVARRSSDTVNAILRDHVKVSGLPRFVRDISTSVSYKEFEQAIVDSALIITNRLHVGLFGFLLGKEVVLQEGSYFKIKAIYEMSLSDSKSVTLVPR